MADAITQITTVVSNLVQAINPTNTVPNAVLSVPTETPNNTNIISKQPIPPQEQKTISNESNPDTPETSPKHVTPQQPTRNTENNEQTKTDHNYADEINHETTSSTKIMKTYPKKKKKLTQFKH